METGPVGSAGERQARLDLVHITAAEHEGLAETATALGALAGQQVAHARMMGLDLATRGYLEPLGYRFLRFDSLRTTHKERAA